MRRMATPCNEEQRGQTTRKMCNRRRSGLTRKVKVIDNEKHTVCVEFVMMISGQLRFLGL